LVELPEDGTPPTRELKPAFEEGNTHTVFLGIPVLDLSRANIAGGSADGSRFRLDVQELQDENTGVNTQHIQVRLLNLTLLVSTEDPSGYEVIPLARIGRSSRAEATPVLDLAYIPPVLACDGWKPLMAEILEHIYHRIGQKLERLAGKVVSRRITFNSVTQED